MLNFSRLSIIGDMISLPFTKNVNIRSYVTKFRYYSPRDAYGGGCIGYLDGDNTVWKFNDFKTGENLMRSEGEWITCQFEIPEEVNTFRIVMKDSRNGWHDRITGDAYFDDIQIAPGSCRSR